MAKKTKTTTHEEPAQQEPASEPAQQPEASAQTNGGKLFPDADNPQDDGKPGPKLADAARNALNALGTDASIKDVEGWLSIHYPGFTYNRPSLSSKLSQLRSSMEGGSSPARTTATSSAPRSKPAPQTYTALSEPTLADLNAVDKLADELNLPIDDLLATVQQVHDMVAVVGSLDKLLKCCEALHKFSQKK